MEIDPLIGELARDEAASSQQLVERAARALVAFSGGYVAESADEFLSGLVEVGRKLVRAKPSLAPLFHLVTELYARASEPADLVMVRRALRTAAVEFTQSLESRTQKVAQQAAELLESAGRVLTLGRSFQVERGLVASVQAGTLAGSVLGEGRPRYDGRFLAEELVRAGAMGVRLVTDAALARYLPECDVVFVGAEAVRAEGIVSRIGSNGLTTAAKQAGKPVYALAGVLRILPEKADLPDPLVTGDPAVVWEDPPEGVTVENPLYEITPLKAFKGIVMENGPISPYDAEQRARNMPVPPWIG